MSKIIIIHDAAGQIISTHEGMEDAQASDFAERARKHYEAIGHSVIEHESTQAFEVNAEEHFVRDGKPVHRGRRPSDSHVFDFEQGQWRADAATAAAAARAKRAQLLYDTDWSQGTDVPPETRQRWQPYRQALREIPQQPGFPFSVQWPVAPA